MIVNIKRFAIFVLMVILQTARCDENPKLYLSVYYESKCPDSAAFIFEQLIPAVNLLKDYLILKLIPFGKADSINEGYIIFTCQHGESECFGNMVQDCTLHQMTERSDAEKLSYVSCEMQSLAGTKGNLQCVRKANVPISQVNDCLSSTQGTELQLNAEYLTKLVKPSFIPTITINGVFQKEVQDRALVNLIATLCSSLGKVKPCAEYYNRRALQNIFFE